MRFFRSRAAIVVGLAMIVGSVALNVLPPHSATGTGLLAIGGLAIFSLSMLRYERAWILIAGLISAGLLLLALTFSAPGLALELAGQHKTCLVTTVAGGRGSDARKQWTHTVACPDRTIKITTDGTGVQPIGQRVGVLDDPSRTLRPDFEAAHSVVGDALKVGAAVFLLGLVIGTAELVSRQ
jgi:hypothetical protein